MIRYGLICCSREAISRCLLTCHTHCFLWCVGVDFFLCFLEIFPAPVIVRHHLSDLLEVLAIFSIHKRFPLGRFQLPRHPSPSKNPASHATSASAICLAR